MMMKRPAWRFSTLAGQKRKRKKSSLEFKPAEDIKSDKFTEVKS